MSDTSARAVNARRTGPVRRSRFVPLAILLICAAPVAAAVLAYFLGWRPGGAGTNYGQLVQPQRAVPAAAELRLTELGSGAPFDLSSLRGKWIMLAADGGDCGDDCARKLYTMRQIHASMGKEVRRIERVWLIVDDAPVPTIVIRAYDGTHMVRVSRRQAAAFLAPPAGTDADAELARHIWLIDPNGNQMLRFPDNPDPKRLRKDLDTLLRASRIG